MNYSKFSINKRQFRNMKKAQAWGFDLLIGGTIFLGAIIFFYLFTYNYPSSGEETFDILIYEAGLVSDSLLSEGYPVDWNETNVVRIGILSQNKIDSNKLEKFYNLTNTSSGYAKSKSAFNVRNDYFVNLSEPTSVGGVQVTGIGRLNDGAENLIKRERFTIYNNKPVTMYVYMSK
ncbi:hypothetical protein HYV50_02985 [Candidatus Pacearchaeota archaeon]|nr:hypothetical protein [Candidatus Pacearchaeota archaeon]